MSIPAYLRLVGVAVGMMLLHGLPYCSIVVHGFSAWLVVSGGVEQVYVLELESEYLLSQHRFTRKFV